MQIDVVMDVVRHEDRLLILSKARDYREERERYSRNPWEIPGGKIEAEPPYSYQDIRDAARRELREETGLDGTVMSIGGTYERTQDEDGQRLEITFHPVLLTVGQLDLELSDEHDRARWIDRETFREIVTANETTALERVR
ncbi:MAG: NUDIX hydrolase [Candidatus Nanohaloarchaea archaeon]|nr:NUDIX hydrolase [Candidatus Nanohaloarchaea archaeon]